MGRELYFEVECDLRRLEYENALEQIRSYGQLQRRDMYFVTVVQGAALTVVQVGILELDFAGWAIGIIALFTAYTGWVSHRRLYEYICAYAERGREIENETGMKLLTEGKKRVDAVRLPSNNRLSTLFYGILIAGWLVILLLNVLARGGLGF